jgi:3-phosphoshikimate 1-carboxyvinyltransferase
MSDIKQISVAASKSYLQRALAIATLAKEKTFLHDVSWCNDSSSAKAIVESLGVKISESARVLELNAEGLQFKERQYNAGEAGLSIRMFAPILALSGDELSLTGEGSLKKRPVDMIVEALQQLGVEIESNQGFLPLKIKGPLQSGHIEIDGSISSQLLTGLLIALPLVEDDSVIRVKNLKSIPYIDMTIEIMVQFGVKVEHENYQIFRIKGHQKYKASNYQIEGDWSGGAFFLVYGAVKNGIEVLNLNYDSRQADKAIVEVLQLVGAKVTLKKTSVIVEKKELRAFEFDATNCPDLFPPLVCLASQCEGESQLKGVSRLKHKESDRASVLKEEFAKMGIEISIKNDAMFVKGAKPKACVVDSHDDHRIAMAAALMNLFCDEEIKIENKEAIDKSYPSFFEELYNL